MLVLGVSTGTALEVRLVGAGVDWDWLTEPLDVAADSAAMALAVAAPGAAEVVDEAPTDVLVLLGDGFFFFSSSTSVPLPKDLLRAER